ncbi:hypothetical protein [Salinimicrobium sp. GXAS 041]|uniref:hypothetical protein n=1 Tax=Salinimicrobium sp. GXAS 041 TaxID=3400806 RepID=UPI003C72A8C0
MKKGIFGILSVFLLAGCVEEKKASREGEPVLKGEDTVQSDFTLDDIDEDRDNVRVQEEATKTRKESVNYEFTGTYQRQDTEATGESCGLLEISFATTSEVCIVPGEIYISVDFEKTDSNHADIFLVEPTNIENAQNKLPWDEFDRDTPIATLELQSNGTLELDWKGFHINKELATDYAILGKKTLEGTYERK